MANKELQILKDKIEALEKNILSLTGIVTELHTILTSKDILKKLETEEWPKVVSPIKINPFSTITTTSLYPPLRGRIQNGKIYSYNPSSKENKKQKIKERGAISQLLRQYNG